MLMSASFPQLQKEILKVLRLNNEKHIFAAQY
jgi:hypothetical protein